MCRKLDKVASNGFQKLKAEVHPFLIAVGKCDTDLQPVLVFRGKIAKFHNKTRLTVMDTDVTCIKLRELAFRGPSSPSLTADSALPLLTEVEGVQQATRLDPLRIEVTYDLRMVTLEQIEYALQEVGFHLDNSLIFRLKRALYYFTEDNQRQNMGLTKLSCAQGCAIKIFASRYQRLKHGCQDVRPEHLRQYL